MGFERVSRNGLGRGPSPEGGAGRVMEKNGMTTKAAELREKPRKG